MTLYADKIFLEGFIMDAAVFYFVSVILRTYLKLKKILLFAALGALAEVILMCLFAEKPLIYILSAFLADAFASWLLFRPKGVFQFIKVIFLTVIFSALLYGLLAWVKKISNLPDSVMYYFKSYGIKNSVTVFLVTSGLAFLVFNIAGKWKESAFSDRDYYCKITLIYAGKAAETDALIDTGCFINDGAGEAVVIPIEKAVLLNILTERQREDFIFDRYDSNKDVSYIEFSSLGKSNGQLPVLKLDYANAILSDGTLIKFKNAKAAVFSGRFSSAGGYHAIISRRDIDIWRQEI
jgi:sigma-E processing peptidase SpoIIGA